MTIQTGNSFTGKSNHLHQAGNIQVCGEHWTDYQGVNNGINYQPQLVHHLVHPPKLLPKPSTDQNQAAAEGKLIMGNSRMAVAAYTGEAVVSKKDRCHGCNLGGGFKHFLFSSLFGEMIQFDQYFSDGLKPPTSNLWGGWGGTTLEHSKVIG